jgi:hypothetical protein
VTWTVTAFKNETVGNPIVINFTCAAGDRLIAYAVSDSTGADPTVPGTWTAGQSQDTSPDGGDASWGYKLADGTETSVSIAGNAGMIGGVLVCSGGDASVVLDLASPTPANNDTGASSPATITNTIVPVTSGALIIGIMNADVTASTDVAFSFSGGSLSWTVPTNADVSAGFRNIGAGYATQTTAASITVTGTATFSSGVAGRALFLIALRPAAAGSPFSASGVSPIGLNGTLEIQAGLSISAVIPIAAVAPVALQGILGISGAVEVVVKMWRIPTDALASTSVHVTILSGSGQTYSIVTQGLTTVNADGHIYFPAQGTIGQKSFAYVHNYDDNTETTSIYGGPCVATIVDAG